MRDVSLLCPFSPSSLSGSTALATVPLRRSIGSMVGVGVVERMTPRTMRSESDHAIRTMAPTCSHVLSPVDLTKMSRIHTSAMWASIIQKALTFVVTHMVNITYRFTVMCEKERNAVRLPHCAVMVKASISHGVNMSQPWPTF